MGQAPGGQVTWWKKCALFFLFAIAELRREVAELKAEIQAMLNRQSQFMGSWSARWSP
jgi:hypothetical protein